MSIKVQEGRKFNFTMLENDIIDNVDRYTKSEVLAYMVLSRYANSDDSCYPSYNTIAKKMRCSRQTAIDAIDSLEKKGVIKKQTRKNENNKENSTNIYKLIGAVTIGEISEEILKQRECKTRRAKQIKELNENQNVKLVKEIAPHIRMGRMQKIGLIDLDYEVLEEALDRTLYQGGKTFNYVIMTYNTVLEETKNNIDPKDHEEIKNNIDEKEKKEKKIIPNFEFIKTELHQVAYINYIENGFDSLSNKEIKLLFELENAGLISLDEKGA